MDEFCAGTWTLSLSLSIYIFCSKYLLFCVMIYCSKVYNLY